MAGLALTYLRIALLGAVPMLLMLAATGVLRGLQDTRTPLVVAVAGNLANIALNLLLVYGIGSWPGPGHRRVRDRHPDRPARLGGGPGVVVVRARPPRARRGCAPPPGDPRVGPLRRTADRPHPAAAGLAAGDDLRAARLGDDELATMQLALTIWTFLAFALDAVAIAAQAITGRYLGAADAVGHARVTRRMEQWGWVSGIVTGLLLAAARPVVGRAVHHRPRSRTSWSRCCSSRPWPNRWPGIVFVLDGVLIGAGDAVSSPGRSWRPWRLFAPRRPGWSGAEPGLVWLWLAFGVLFMGARAVTLLGRAHGDRWMRLGA